MSSRLGALKSVKKIVYAPEVGIGGLTILTPLNSVLVLGCKFYWGGRTMQSQEYSLFSLLIRLRVYL